MAWTEDERVLWKYTHLREVYIQEVMAKGLTRKQAVEQANTVTGEKERMFLYGKTQDRFTK